VDSEELAGRLESGGFRVVGEPADADAVLVNTCGFIETAKKDSVDTLLAAAGMDAPGDGRERAVVAVGCLAQRYGTELPTPCPKRPRCSASMTTRTSPLECAGCSPVIARAPPHPATGGRCCR
jgi:tRNA A37 methylthiotransferase MiaB